MSTANTGYTIYNEEEFIFGEFTSLKPKILKNGKLSKAKKGGIFDISIFYENLISLKETYNDCNIKIVYATFRSMGNFATAGTLYKLVGVLELIFKKENIIEVNESSARKHCGINKIVSTRFKYAKDSVLNPTKLRRKLYKEEAINFFKKEINNEKNNVSDDIADSYVIMKYFLDVEYEEDLPI